MYCIVLTTCILDQGQVIKYLCRISLVMYLVYYNYSNAGPECQAKVHPSNIPWKFGWKPFISLRPPLWPSGYSVSLMSMRSWFNPRLRQTKVFKTGSSGFLPWHSGLSSHQGIALQLARQCQDSGLVKYWLKIVQETWICELLPLNNWNTVDVV